MTEKELETILDFFTNIDGRLRMIEKAQFNKLTVAKIIDISNDKVHVVKQVVRMYETPDGVVIHIV